MARCGLVLFCLVALFSSVALASLEVSADGDHGRQLLQSPNGTDCDRSVKNCLTCRYQFYRGTVTKAICLTCKVGFTVKASGRGCWCAPGYYLSAPDTCTACGANYYCPGAKTTPAAAHEQCGDNKITTNDYAKSDRECVVRAGYGWAPGNGSAICEAGYYNPGFNTRACTRCPGGLTTELQGTNSSTACQAPAGYYYLRGKAIACAQGFYKTSLGNTDCASCPDGWTTKFGEVAKTAANACTYLQPGYFAPLDSMAVGTDNATICPADTYGLLEREYTGTTISCTACPTNMKTFPGILGATSKDACLAPPGYGWDAATQAAVECAAGTYNPGWNRETCSSCGSGNMTTDASKSTSADQCYTPAGYGNQRDTAGVLTAFECPLGTYGRNNKTYGLVDVECTKCLDHSTTNTTASQTQAACLTAPGYGWYSGQVLQCEYGTWSSGYSQNPCKLCGEGYNTTADSSVTTTTALLGATTSSTCAIAAGWQYAVASNPDAGLAPCTRGAYKELIGNANCTQCPSGTTTAIAMAATELSDCNSCRPGFQGTSSGLISDLEAPTCQICTSGTYAPGYKVGGEACASCPLPTGYTGAMVSRNGISTPEDCVGQFPSDGSDNFLEWDIIAMGDGVLTGYTGTGYTTVEECQSKCKDDLTCQYFAFYNYKPDGVNECFLRKAAATIAKITFNVKAPGATDFAVMFEVKTGIYAAYLAKDTTDAGSIGTNINTYSAFDDAKTACDKDATCVGFANTGTSAWRTFAGAKWEGAVGKVRAFGPALNSWVAEPTP